MNLLLVLRSELACFVILIFLFFMAKKYNVFSQSKAFKRMICFAIAHVIFDAITVVTVNNLDIVPHWLNDTCHILFYLTAIFYSTELVSYTYNLCYPRTTKRFYAACHILALLYILALPFLPIEYISAFGTNSSSGLAAYIGYGLAFLLFANALVIILAQKEKMPKAFGYALVPMMLVLIATEVCQVIWREVLFTGGAITIVTVGFFFALENPVEVFKKKALTDALTGVRSRNSYEEDLSKYDLKFAEYPGNEYTFVFCDINDLRKVNNLYGHAEGDNYITTIASAIKHCMKSGDAIYRIGGDEFLIMYIKVPLETMQSELQALQDACTEACKNSVYRIGVTTGYAQSAPNYKTLRDVVKSADFDMYQNKVASKAGSSKLGPNLNYAGLTDPIFDALSASNERSYPYITNLETNVTRIAKSWKEYFGLTDEFYTDFLAMWGQRIHPDYLEPYMDDVIQCVNGHKKYHIYEYYAKRADGEYVKCICHGSLYNDGNGATYFAGTMENYGADSAVDSVTGRPNFDVMTAKLLKSTDTGTHFSLLKLKLINFGRVNMLYGYEGGDKVIKKLSEVIGEVIGDSGILYCQGAVNFTAYLYTVDETAIKGIYDRLVNRLSSGIETEIGLIPVSICGGSVIVTGQKVKANTLRSALVYALEESLNTNHNSLVFYRLSTDTLPGTDINLLSQIHADALGAMQFFRLRYQPIVDIATQKTVGAEALLRWIHPIHGEVPPGKFIDFIEKDPCYYRLGLRIIEEAVKDAKDVQSRIPSFRISVNITSLQLRNDAFIDNICEILQKYDYEPSCLVLEMTERCKELDTSFLAKKISAIKAKGILVAFDDLGTGYSTVSILMDIPVDEVKLDREFVKDLATRDSYKLFVKALVLGSASKGYNYTICFEGIENAEMLGLVGQYGNFLAQGYYFAKPLLINEFNEYISK